MHHSGIASCALFVLAPLAAAAGKVWVVAPQPAPGVDFTDLGSACAAAASGDLIVVRDGNYAPQSVSITGKALTLVGDLRLGQVPIHAALSFDAGDAPRELVLRNLGFSAGTPGEACLDANTRGAVAWFEACSAEAAPGSQAGGGIALHGAGGLQLIRADVRAGVGDALALPLARAAIWTSFAWGAPGSSAQLAGAALRAGDFAFGSGSLLIGGPGAPGGDLGGGCLPAASPGAPALVLQSGSQGLFVATDLFGGDGGNAPQGCTPGSAGAAVQNEGGTLATPFGFARGLEAPGIVREGEAVLLSINALPGEIAILMWGLGTAVEPVLALNSVLGIAPLAGAFAIGPVQGGGSVPIGFQVAELGAGVEWAALYLQPAFVNAQGKAAVGAPSVLIAVDQAF